MKRLDTLRDNALATALNASDRWELIGGRTLVPAGARYAVLRFTADRDSGTSNDAWLDKAFLYAVSEAYVPDLGAYGHATHEAPASADTRILLRFPDMYTDWERLADAVDRLKTASIFIDETPALNSAELRARARALLRRQRCKTWQGGFSNA